MKKTIITQSNYVPWKGYFDSIKLADEVILLDDVQYTKRDWRNRNIIKTPNGLLWLSIPVKSKGEFFQTINQTLISDLDWNKRHWKTIRMSYAKAPYFNDYKDFFEDLYLNCNETYLSQVNYRFICGILEILDIKTKITLSSDFDLVKGRSERLLDLCLRTGTTEYLSGPAAKDYLDVSIFENNSIKVNFLDYSNYKEYPQLYPPYESSVSVIDLIMNTGKHAADFLKF